MGAGSEEGGAGSWEYGESKENGVGRYEMGTFLTGFDRDNYPLKIEIWVLYR
jgi:hypothetical protein